MRYAITDLTHATPGTSFDAVRRRRTLWLASLRHWADSGVHFVQLREKALEIHELYALAQAGADLLRSLRHTRNGQIPSLLINSRPDIAIAAGLRGVHLSSQPGELTPAQVRLLFQAAGFRRSIVSLSCHTPEEAHAARNAGADVVLFAPVFEKRLGDTAVLQGQGLANLQRAVRLAAPAPVFALGGVSEENTPACLRAGAAGIAGIRRFALPSTSYEAVVAMRK